MTMIEETARVLSSEGELAVVETRRAAACGGCDSQNHCGTSLLAGLFGKKPVRVTVHNPIGARPGDRVVVGLSGTLLTKASILLYLVPILFLVLFALAGQWLAQYLGLFAEPWSVISGVSGLALGIWWAGSRSGSLSGPDAGQAVILRRVQGERVELGLTSELTRNIRI